MIETRPLESVVSSDALQAPEVQLPVGSEPDRVVSPGDVDECARVMAWASECGVGVLPVGNGGQLRPVAPGRSWVALSTHRLDGIETYEAADLTLTAGSGTAMADIGVAMRREGQWAPFDPPGVRQGTIGGLVSTGRSGALWAGYGELRNHVLGATVVTGDGRVLRLGGRVVKNVAGYDLLKLLVGGRGAFGLMTSVCIRAFPEPIQDRVLVLAATSVSELAEASRRIATAPIVPASAVVVDRLPTSDTPGLALRLHGSKVTVDADQRSLEDHLGVKLATVDDPVSFVEGVSERCGAETVVVRLSTSPSHFGGFLELADGDAVSSVALDPYGARGRVAFADSEAATSSGLLERAASDGAWAVERAPADSVLWLDEPAVSDGERALIEGLHRTFDPQGILWPTRS